MSNKYGLGWAPKPDSRNHRYPMTLALDDEDVEKNGPASILWNLGPILDQGQTQHCVGYAWKQWQQTTPLQTLDGPSADDIYAQCKVIDGDNNDGSSTSSGVKSMMNEGRIKTYLWAFDVDTFRSWILTQGPIVVGTCWFTDMFNPNTDGYVAPTGDPAGGHEYMCYGYLKETDSFKFVNSWGTDWGLNGTFWMKSQDVEKLIWNLPMVPGDACAAVEKKLEPISPGSAVS